MAKQQHVDSMTGSTTLGVRHFQCALLFCAFAVSFMMRVNLSVAIVAMLDRNSTNPDFPEYAWSEHTKSLVLSSFFWGYFITQVPGGQLAHKFGGKIMLTYSIAVSGILALCTPQSATIGNWQLLCAVRFVQGLSQGILYPAGHTILSRWAPPEERGVLATFCYSGSQFGSIAMMAVSGVLAASAYGWPSIFYLSGLVSLLWVLVWLIWGAGAPNECKLVSTQEQLYIASLLQERHSDSGKSAATPWRSIFNSLPFLVLIISQCGYNFCYWTMLTQIPSYMKHVLGKDIKSNALLSSLPYVANLALGFVCCVVANALSKRQIISLHVSRKLFNTIGQWVPMLALIALAFANTRNADLAIGLITLSVGFNSASFLGFFVNHIDLSPNFAGILMGVANCAGNIMSVMAPLLVGVVVTDTKNVLQWRIIFMIAAAIYFVANLLFLTLGSTRVQPWNDPPQKREVHKNIKFEVIKNDVNIS